MRYFTVILFITTLTLPVLPLEYNRREYTEPKYSYYSPLPQKTFWMNSIGVGYRNSFIYDSFHYFPTGFSLHYTALLKTVPNKHFFKGFFISFDFDWIKHEAPAQIRHTYLELIWASGSTLGLFSEIPPGRLLPMLVRPLLGVKNQYLEHSVLFPYKKRGRRVSDPTHVYANYLMIGPTVGAEIFLVPKRVSAQLNYDLLLEAFLMDAGHHSSDDSGIRMDRYNINHMSLSVGFNIYLL